MESGLAEDEQRVADLLVKTWEAYCLLHISNSDHVDDFRRAIHEGQRILATRALGRMFPEYWNVKGNA